MGDVATQQLTGGGGGDEGVVRAGKVDKVVPFGVAFQEEFHGVDSVENHGDTAISDELGIHEVYICFKVRVLLEELVLDGCDDGVVHFHVEMDSVDIAGMMETLEQAGKMCSGAICDLNEVGDVGFVRCIVGARHGVGEGCSSALDEATVDIADSGKGRSSCCAKTLVEDFGGNAAMVGYLEGEMSSCGEGCEGEDHGESNDRDIAEDV